MGNFPVVAGRGPPPPSTAQRPSSSLRAIAPAPAPRRPPPPPASKPAAVPQRGVIRDDSDDFRQRRVNNPNRGRGRGRTNTKTRGEVTQRVEKPSPVASQTRIIPRPRPTQPPQQIFTQEAESFQSTFPEENQAPTVRTRTQTTQAQRFNSFEQVEKSKPRIKLPQKNIQSARPEPIRSQQSTLRDSLSSIFSDQANSNTLSDDRFIPEQPRFAAVPTPRPQFTSSVAQTAPTRILTPTTPTPKPVFVFQPAIQTNELNSLQEQVEPQTRVQQQDNSQFSQFRQQQELPQFARPQQAVPQREPAVFRQPTRARPQPPREQVQQNLQPVPQREPAVFRQPTRARPQPPREQVQQNLQPVQQQHRFIQAAPVNAQPFNPTSLFDQEIKAPSGGDGDGVYFSYEATLNGRRR